MYLIEAKDVYKDYVTSGVTVNALRGVSINVELGDFTAICGPSGSGKSTLLHLAGCLDKPTSGSISVDGDDILTMSKNKLAILRRKKIGFIFQAYNLIPVLTAVENASFPLVLLGMRDREARELAAAALNEVGLAGLENRRVQEMSGGQQQRVAIARALVKRPVLILADEPTANLDSKTGQEVLEIMLRLNEDDKLTFLFSTHDSMVMKYAKKTIRLRDGKVVPGGE